MVINKKFWKVTVFLCLCLIANSGTHSGAAENLRGPLSIRDLSPFSLGMLDLKESTLRTNPPKSWDFQLGLSHSNTLILSDNVVRFLRKRPQQGRALTENEIDQISNLAGDVYYFDGALSVADFRVSYQLSSHWYSFFDVGYTHFGGGFLDSSVDAFHNAFGFGDENRSLPSNNQAQVLTKLGGGTAHYRNNSGNQLISPTVGLGWQYSTKKGWTWEVESGASLAAKSSNFFKNSHHSAGISIAAFKQSTKDVWYASIHSVYTGDNNFFEEAASKWVHSLTLSYERRWRPKLSWIIQGSAKTSVFKTTVNHKLSEYEYLMTGGLRWYLKHGNIEAGFTENVIHFDNTSDVAFHLRWNRDI